MQLRKGRIHKLLLILSCLFIPVDIYVIGDWIGAGVQFTFFRVQFTMGWSYISLFRDIQYVIRGVLSGKTGVGILLWTISATVLALTAFLYLFQEDIWKSEGEFLRIS